MPEAAAPVVPQRWVRPFSHEPGHWKLQLPGKDLALAARGDLPGLKRLLAQRPEALNPRGAHGRTLLWEAVRRGRLEAVKFLLARGADVNATGCYNSESLVQLTPYAAAVYYRKSAVAALLRPLKAPEDIFRAAFLGDLEAVAAHLAADHAPLAAEDPHDEIYYCTPLTFAVAGAQVDLAAGLLQRGAPVAAYSAQLIYLAVHVRRPALVTLLLDHGADARAVEGHIFQATDYLDLLRLLLARGTSPTAVGANGFPPLVYLARGDKGEHPEKIALLLEHGADVNARGLQGRTALHYAAAAGHGRVVRQLLAAGADPTLTDDAGRTPRAAARAAGHRLSGL